MKDQHFYSKYISFLYRSANRFFDHQLANHQIGCGQQFFLARIWENEGMSMLDLASSGHYDKGTATKGIQKLVEQGYIRSESDPCDKRIRRLYVTEKARPVIADLYQSFTQWNDILTDGMTGEEAEAAERLLQKMAENVFLHSKSQTAAVREKENKSPK